MSCGEGITCREAMAVVQEFLDGSLEGVSAAQVRAHFEACSRCYPQLKFERSFREALARVTRGEGAPPELRSRVVELLAGVAADESASGERGSD
jgi:anti-sigma factor (TIGR02949 family)